MTAELEKDMKNVKDWMNCNRLKMNDSETEFIVFSSNRMLPYIDNLPLLVGDTWIDMSAEVKLLGVPLDRTLNLRAFVKHSA